MTTFDRLVLTYVILAYVVAIVAAVLERRKVSVNLLSARSRYPRPN